MENQKLKVHVKVWFEQFFNFVMFFNGPYIRKCYSSWQQTDSCYIRTGIGRLCRHDNRLETIIKLKVLLKL